MVPFLRQVAEHYLGSAEDISSICFIFPNRRAEKFFMKYLGEAVASSGRGPLIAPRTVTMNDFFYRMTGSVATDRVQLLVELYSCYSALNPKAESLDDFIFWGDVLLGDFDDVDKYLVDPSHIFTNVADYKAMGDSWDFLTPEQKAAIDNFTKHFNTGGAVKDNFLQIWEILLPLYRSFNEKLSSKGLSYEGMVYRKLASRLESEPVVDLLGERFRGTSVYVFVGLNALNECERKLLRRMRDAGVAEFCWDWRSEMIMDQHNKSSFFMKDNVLEFHPAFTPDPDGLRVPEVNVLSVPSGVGQAKQLPAILERFAAVKGAPAGLETAVVLPDEKLLMPVLNTIPEDIASLNVTMGYPLGASEIWSLMTDIASLQTHLRLKDGKWYFYHRQVWSIFSNSVFKAILDDDSREMVDKVRSNHSYYVSQDELRGNTAMALIFTPVVKDTSDRSREMVAAIAGYQQDVLAAVARGLKDNADMSVEIDFAKECYLAARKLASYGLSILPATYFRLYAQLCAPVSVPFEGEPLQGLQIMGPLETRALDFDNLVILSCNEGMFPRRSVSSSFIPPELRKGFGLPTYEYQDAVWAYYFYRMIQRASTVWMLYDSRTEGVRSGEQSRYIRQLEMHFGVKVNHFVAKAPVRRAEVEAEIPKTESDIEVLRTKRKLSATALKNYLDCPAMFYYATVCWLKEQDEVAESLDAGMLGNVFHHTMEDLYRPWERKNISVAALEAMMKDKEHIRATVDFHIMDELKAFEVTGRNIVLENVVCRYVEKVLQRDRELMDSYGTDHFRIEGIELPLEMDIDGFKFKGVVDRFDSFAPNEVRVVDYKTGKVTDDDFLISDDNAADVVGKLFGPNNADRPKIALQLYLYDLLVKNRAAGRDIVNTIYQTSRLFVKGVENVSLSPKFCSLMADGLDKLLAEISDESVPWRRTDDAKTCEYCNFKNICGR